MRSDFRSYSTFLLKVCLFISLTLIISIPLLAGYLHALKSVGEYFTHRQLAEISREIPVLWLSGYYDSGRFHKTGVGASLKPRIAVLGSSRVMQFRAKMFNKISSKSFYNLGGSCGSMYGSFSTLKRLLKKRAKPELIVFGIDWTWFQSNERELLTKNGSFICRFISKVIPPSIVYRALGWKRYVGRSRDLLLDRIQLIQHAWKDEKFQNALLGGEKQDPVTNRRLMGIGALSGLGGFRNDGSYRYSRLLAEYEKTPPSIEKLREGALDAFKNRNLYCGNYISPSALYWLNEFFQLCREEQIKLICFMPPIEKGMLELFKRNPRSAGFWDAFGRKINSICSSYETPFFDMSDPDTLRSDHMDFFDWFHGSEKLYTQILFKMAEDHNSKTLLSGFLDPEQLRVDVACSGKYLVYGD